MTVREISLCDSDVRRPRHGRRTFRAVSSTQIAYQLRSVYIACLVVVRSVVGVHRFLPLK